MNDILHTASCGCRVVRDEDGCGVHIEWCSLHGAAGEMREACYGLDAAMMVLEDLDQPTWDTLDDYLSVNIIEFRAALAKVRGENLTPPSTCGTMEPDQKTSAADE